MFSSTFAVPEGGGGSGPPQPPEKSQAIGFLSNTGPDNLENHKASIPQGWAIIHPPAKRHFYGVSQKGL